MDDALSAGEVVGRIMKTKAALEGITMVLDPGLRPPRGPRGDARGRDGGVRQVLAARPE